MSEETDLLKSAVAHHGSTLLFLGKAFYDYRNAHRRATDSFDKDIPISVQRARVKALANSYDALLWVVAEMLGRGANDVQPSGDEVLPASVD